MRVIITVPDKHKDDPEEVADYVLFVSEQIREEYTSGHVSAEQHWTQED